MLPETHYARSGDVSIAYQVLGDGPFDVVFVPPALSNVELGWDVPNVRAFLERLHDAIARGLTPAQREKVEAAESAGGDPLQRLLAVQVALAKELPDYWQRFEASRVAWAEAPPASGGERRSLLRRLFGRG